MATATIRLTNNFPEARALCGMLGASRVLTYDNDLWRGASDHLQNTLTAKGITFTVITSVNV